MVMVKGEEIKTIEGLVTPIEWDDAGKPLRVKICTAGEIDYLVQETEEGIRLLDLVQNLVTVRGYVSTGRNSRLIRVQSIESERGV